MCETDRERYKQKEGTKNITKTKRLPCIMTMLQVFPTARPAVIMTCGTPSHDCCYKPGAITCWTTDNRQQQHRYVCRLIFSISHKRFTLK